jgi:hypothetical protein
MSIFKFLEVFKKNNGKKDMVIQEIDKIDGIVADSKKRILKSINSKDLKSKSDASFDLRMICLKVLEDLKSQGKIISYDNALVLKTHLENQEVPVYDLEYIMVFRINNGTVHKYIYCDNVLERKAK